MPLWQSATNKQGRALSLNLAITPKWQPPRQKKATPGFTRWNVIDNLMNNEHENHQVMLHCVNE
jgi:hypothetical protein